MAKMKVYELAQEMGLQSKDILTALKNKGIEVKSHMSVLEDGQVEDLKNSLKAPAKSEETPKAAEADKKEQPADAKAPVKKKKSIIFVSNPHNSKMPGAQIPRKPAHQEKKAAPAPAQAAKAAEPVKAAAKPVETSKAAEAPVKAAEPVNTTVKAETKPEIVKPVETAPAPETPKAAPAPQPKAETAVEAPKATEAPKAAPAQDNRAAQTSAPRQQSGSQDRNSDRNQDRRQGYNNGSRQYDNQRRSDNNNYQRRDGGQQRSFDGNGNRRDGGQQRSFDGNRRDGGQQRSFDGNRRDGGQRNNDGNRRPFDQTDRMQDQDRALAATEAVSTRMMTDVITTEAASAASRVADQDRRVIILFQTARLRTQRSIETKRSVVSARRRIRRTARI